MDEIITAIIVYDISDDKRRYKCMKLLNSFGYRVQYSVYETNLSSKKFKSLQESIKKIEHKDDSIIIYRISSVCNKIVFGQDNMDIKRISEDLYL